MKENRITESNMSEALSQIDTLDGLNPKDSGCIWTRTVKRRFLKMLAPLRVL